VLKQIRRENFLAGRRPKSPFGLRATIQTDRCPIRRGQGAEKTKRLSPVRDTITIQNETPVLEMGTHHRKGVSLIVPARTYAFGPRLPTVGCESGACILQAGWLRPAHGFAGLGDWPACRGRW